MAAPSSTMSKSNTPKFVLPNFTHMSITKLEGENYISSLNQVLPIIRRNDLMGIVDGSKICPPKYLSKEDGQTALNLELTCYTKKDQFLLGWLDNTLVERVLSEVYGLNTSKLLWTSLANKFASQSNSRISHIKHQLQGLRQGSITCFEFLQTAKRWADQLAAIGKPMEDDNLIHFLISGLNPTFFTFITTLSLMNRGDSLRFDVFQHELLNHEMLLNQQHVVTLDNSNFNLFSNKIGARNGPHRHKMPLQPFRSS